MSKSSRRQRQAGVSQLVAVGGPRFWRLAHAVPRSPQLSAPARSRLAMLEWHAAHGACVALTARHFGFSRPTVYPLAGTLRPLPAKQPRGPLQPSPPPAPAELEPAGGGSRAPAARALPALG